MKPQVWFGFTCQRCDRLFRSTIIRLLCGACGSVHDALGIKWPGEVSGT